VLVDESH
jgi:hypothetical protein